MTINQKIALKLMSDNRLGAVLCAGFGYVWPTHIRGEVPGVDGELAAVAVIEKLETTVGVASSWTVKTVRIAE